VERTSASSLEVVSTTTGNRTQRLVGLDLGQRLAPVLLGHVEGKRDDPGTRGVDAGAGPAPLAAQVVEQVLAVDGELHLVGQRGVLQRIAGELAVLLVVVVGEQDRERPRRGVKLRTWGSSDRVLSECSDWSVAGQPAGGRARGVSLTASADCACRVTVEVEPCPRTLSAITVPPCRSAILRHRAGPIPVPE